MDWFEPLPKQCPPNDATSPKGFIVYRLAYTNPPLDEDFKSQKALAPQRTFKDECVARALSVQDDYLASEQLIKLPTQQGKQVIKLVLNDTDGLIKKTFGPNHYSWWRSIQYNIPTEIEL